MVRRFNGSPLPRLGSPPFDGNSCWGFSIQWLATVLAFGLSSENLNQPALLADYLGQWFVIHF